MTAYTCLTCDAGPFGPDRADEHDDAGHDVRRLPDDNEPRDVPPDAGHVETFRGVRVGRRRADY